MTPHEQAILDLMCAAENAGLDPVVELPDDAPPRSVDLRVMDGDQVAAAIRVFLAGGQWRYEIPARPQGWQTSGVFSRHLAGVDQDVTPDMLRVLDHWFSQVTPLRPAAPRPATRWEDVPGWMRPGYRENRGVVRT